MTIETAYEPDGFLVPGVLPPAYGRGWAIPGQLQPAYGNDGLIFNDPSIGFDPRVTFTRSTIANRFNSAGTLTSTAIDVARANQRQDYNPSTLAARGFLIEAGATNLLLGSAVLATQDVTVTAVAHTLSFYGTGTVTLTGTSTAGPLVGTGANDLVTLTFTPTAGTLTLTVSGSVLNAQLETGSVATSRITTVGSQVARGADNATISTLSSIGFSSTQGFLYAEFMLEGIDATITRRVWSFSDGTTNNAIRLFINPSTGAPRFNVITGGVQQASVGASAVTAMTLAKIACSWSANAFRLAINGASATEDTAGTVPTVTQLDIGHSLNDVYLQGWIPRMQYAPQLLTNAQLAAMTA